MAISDSIYLNETETEIIIIVDDTSCFKFYFSANNPRRSNDYYIYQAIQACE